MKESFLFLAEGFEEIEALTAVDILRRAEIPVKTVSITPSLQVVGAHGITVTADLHYDNIHFSSPKWLILPGGMPGASNLYSFPPLQGLLAQQAASEEGRIAAICAAPSVVLGQMGLLRGEKATCYPGFESDAHGADYSGAPVEVSGKFVTGNGPANAMLWALTIVAEEKGEKFARGIANGLLLYPTKISDLDNYFG